jgi:hypothetical protein
VVCGGKPDANAPGYTFPLTIVTGVTDGARLVDEEQFGPVLPVMKYSADEEVCIALMRLEIGQGHIEQMRPHASFSSDSSSRTVSIYGKYLFLFIYTTTCCIIAAFREEILASRFRWPVAGD